MPGPFLQGVKLSENELTALMLSLIHTASFSPIYFKRVVLKHLGNLTFHLSVIAFVIGRSDYLR